MSTCYSISSDQTLQKTLSISLYFVYRIAQDPLPVRIKVNGHQGSRYYHTRL